MPVYDISETEKIEAAIEEQLSKMSDKVLKKVARDFGLKVPAHGSKNKKSKEDLEEIKVNKGEG
ncbi:MAG: hypothetical protein FWE72_00780 [Spirochaetaceae bacterium]|nr:hypothetical protein [Spirochaetaceae bacterium]